MIKDDSFELIKVDTKGSEHEEQIDEPKNLNEFCI